MAPDIFSSEGRSFWADWVGMIVLAINVVITGWTAWRVGKLGRRIYQTASLPSRVEALKAALSAIEAGMADRTQKEPDFPRLRGELTVEIEALQAILGERGQVYLKAVASNMSALATTAVPAEMDGLRAALYGLLRYLEHADEQQRYEVRR